MSDPFDLRRFVAAQDADDTYRRALAELRAGRKRGHWMWFVFPQLVGLGRSAMAQRYAISGLPEARAYLAHPTLGPRLVECARALTALPGHDAAAVLGPVDALKLRSSMTLFAAAAPGETATPGETAAPGNAPVPGNATAPGRQVFTDVLDRYFGGPDEATSSRL